MTKIDVADEIAHNMQQALEENAPTGYFTGVAMQIADTAAQLDAVNSPLAPKVDSLLNKMVLALGDE